MTERERLVVRVAILASFVAFLDGSIVNVALPAIREDLGGGLAIQQWVLDAYLLALGALILTAGAISDTYGRVRVLRWGLVAFGVASVACALAPSGALLIGSRGLQGVAAALLVPSSLALITATFDGPARGTAIGTWTAWTSTAFVVGPLIGGVLVDTTGWRWVFGINVLPLAVTLVLLARLDDPVRTEPAARVDFVGATLAAAGLGGSVFAFIEQARLGWTHLMVLVPLVLGVVCLAGFLWWESHATHPMMPLRLFRDRTFAAGNLATAAIYAGLSLGLLVVVLYLQEVAGFSATSAGLATVPIAVFPLVLGRYFGSMAGAKGPRALMSVGPLVAGGGFLLMLTAAEPFNFWLQLLPGLMTFGIGVAMTVAPLTAAVLGSVPPELSGVGSAINNAVSRVAGLVAIAFAGSVIGPTLGLGSFHRAMVVSAVLLFIGAVVSAAGVRNAEQAATPEAVAACHDRILPAGSHAATAPPADGDR
jgi:EmrB/QacA subfamily drug resistance transporter